VQREPFQYIGQSRRSIETRLEENQKPHADKRMGKRGNMDTNYISITRYAELFKSKRRSSKFTMFSENSLKLMR
jgi:hypothetical protein